MPRFREYLLRLLTELRGWSYVEMSAKEAVRYGGLKQVRNSYEVRGMECLYRNNRPIDRVAMWIR